MSEPIRILHVVTHMNRGGLESMIMNYFRNIDRSLVMFDFLTHRPEGEKKDYDDEILSLGGRIYHVSAMNPFSKSYLKELDGFFKSHPEYRIVHVHQDCLSGIVLKVAMNNGIPIRIGHCHSSSQDKGVKYFVKTIYKRNIKNYATKLFACGQESGKWMFGCNNFSVLPNAIDSNLFIYNDTIRRNVRKQLGIADDYYLIGNVGRFSKVKNHIFMIDILKELIKFSDKIRMIFVGDGELMKKIKEETKKRKLERFVIFLGLRSDISEILQSLDIFLLPSLYEGLPVSIIEAQASGLRCFISDKVPKECIITNLVKQISLEKPAAYWAEQIMRAKGYKRHNMQYDVINANFDIKRNSMSLEKFYRSEYRKLN